MKQEHRQQLQNDLETVLGRQCKPHELGNIENDALLLVRCVMKRLEEFEERLKKLEK